MYLLTTSSRICFSNEFQNFCLKVVILYEHVKMWYKPIYHMSAEVPCAYCYRINELDKILMIRKLKNKFRKKRKKKIIKRQ